MVIIYTDGAIKTSVKGKDKRIVLGWGFVALDSEGEIIKESLGTVTGPEEKLKSRSIGAELEAVRKALEWAIKNKIKRVMIIHDFAGCGEWGNGTWRSNVPISKDYAEFVEKCREDMEIGFYLVKGHSGDKWNDYADNLAKKALT